MFSGTSRWNILLFFAVFLWAAFPALAQEDQSGGRRLAVVLFPTENHTELEVWQSRYYPFDVLKEKMTDYFASLFRELPMVDVRVLDKSGMDEWLQKKDRGDDMALQMELCRAVMKERDVVGPVETGRVALRVRIFDAVSQTPYATRAAIGKDVRYTFDPGDDKLFWTDALIVSLPLPFKEGLDALGLTGGREQGQKMSRPTWQQFSGSSHWQALKNAIDDAYRQSMDQVSNVIKRNEPQLADDGTPAFSPSFTTVGRIISPAEDSTRKKPRYIISLGRRDAVKTGEVLDVVRSDTYVTVDPEHPVVVLPKTIGKVKIVYVQDQEAVVRVIRENKKEPVMLKDLVIKTTRPLK